MGLFWVYFARPKFRFNLETTTAKTQNTSIETSENVNSAYALNYRSLAESKLVENKGKDDLNSTGTRKVALSCKSCKGEFDSTFSVEEFSALPHDQFGTGTLHLCPHCGNLSIYMLTDYHEPKA